MRELLISASMLTVLFAYAWYERRASRRDHPGKERGSRHVWVAPAKVRGMPRRRISRAGNVPLHKAS